MNPAQPTTSINSPSQAIPCYIVSKRPMVTKGVEYDGETHVITRMREFGYTFIENARCLIGHGSSQSSLLSVFKHEGGYVGIIDDIHDLPDDELCIIPLDVEIL